MSLTPGAAVLWTFLVPGLAHLRLGRGGRAALAFLSTGILFWLGYSMLSWGEGHSVRLWHFALFQPFALLQPVLGIAPLQLLPESANLGNSIVASLLRPGEVAGMDPNTVPRLMRGPSEWGHIASFLTAASGMVAIFWAADAHWLAGGRKVSGPSPSRVAFLSWLLPGLGHWQAGQRDKGLVMGGAVILVFAIGLLCSMGHAVDRGLQPVWWVGQVLFGGGALFAGVFTAPLQFTSFPQFFDLGLVLCTAAGLLNLVVMIDAYTVAERGVQEMPA
ncbi:MAG: hypothetical protein O7E49_14655 [Gemmatimonadetes bacterium]|nr:hypothetical protein [Gemmatimonadota bacterium]